MGAGQRQQTAHQILIGSVALVASSVLPYLLGLVDVIYLAGVLGTGVWFMKVSLQAGFDLTGKTARKVFLASIIYQPVLLALLVIDRLIL